MSFSGFIEKVCNSISKTEIFFWLSFTLVEAAPVVNTLESGVDGSEVWAFIMSVMIMSGCLVVILITAGYAIPHLLMRGKWKRYVLILLLMSYVFSFCEILGVTCVWRHLDLIPSDRPIKWGWLNLNVVSCSLIFSLSLLGMGIGRLILANRADLEVQKRLSDRIEEYMERVRSIIRPSDLSRRLKEIAGIICERPEEGETRIKHLCNDLRKELYELPHPPHPDPIPDSLAIDLPFTSWLISPRYRWVRLVGFQLTVCIIAMGALFSVPDSPEFVGRWFGFLMLVVVMDVLALVVGGIFYRQYRKKRNQKAFIRKVVILAAGVMVPFTIECCVSLYTHGGPYSVSFIVITIVAVFFSILTFLFYIGGITAILLTKDWILETRNIVMLEATSKRLEYSWLKKQINPHFLFNVLNNASILAYFEPEEAQNILSGLERLVSYQFEEAHQETVSLESAMGFLHTYLDLESVRHNNFPYQITLSGEVKEIRVPGMLFIPYVENAVKHGSRRENIPRVDISFTVKRKTLLFECINPYHERKDSEDDRALGIGIDNTLRRLELLYGDQFSCRVFRNEGLYRVILEIPLG